MEDTSRSDAQIDIKPSHAPSVSFDFADGPIREQRAPFFRSASRQRRDTWIISLFTIVHIVVFVSTMAVNNCAEASHGDCALKVLGRLSFQPLSENPLLGPSASTWVLISLYVSTFGVTSEHWPGLWPCIILGFVIGSVVMIILINLWWDCRKCVINFEGRPINFGILAQRVWDVSLLNIL